MLKSSVQFRRSMFLVVSAFTSSTVFAAGFEKNVLWSGKYQGFGGAAASSVNNSEAMYFNPAGLGFLEGKGDVRLNFSPTLSEFSGPVSATQPDKKSEQGFSPVGGLTSAYKLNDTVVLGAGIFTSGGTNTKYKDIAAGSNPAVDLTDGKATSDLKIIDFTLGSAVQLNEKFSVGAAWRATYAMAELVSTGTAGGGAAGVEVTYKDLSAWDFNSFRVGAQYRGEDLGVGLNVRTAVPLSLEGKATVRTASTSTDFSNASVAASFPFQIALGSDYKLTNRWTLFTEASWTNYSTNQDLDVTVPDNATLSNSDIILKWHDQWVARLGTEWQFSESIAFRAGYVFTSKVTSEKYARATFSAPGIGHTFTVGSGFDFGAWDMDVALDYSLVRGDGRNDSDNLSGDFTTDSIAAHLGVAYTY